MKNLRQILEKLPAERRAKIAGRTRELISEEVALQHIRKARELTQEQMAKLLGIRQDSVSRIESRSDLLLSTLTSYVEAMGGTLSLIARFPDGSVTLSSLGANQLSPSTKPAKTHKHPTRGGRLSVVHASE